jgi:hypothetical protein
MKDTGFSRSIHGGSMAGIALRKIFEQFAFPERLMPTIKIGAEWTG